jgi:hypothetical protein
MRKVPTTGPVGSLGGQPIKKIDNTMYNVFTLDKIPSIEPPYGKIIYDC